MGWDVQGGGVPASHPSCVCLDWGEERLGVLGSRVSTGRWEYSTGVFVPEQPLPVVDHQKKGKD